MEDLELFRRMALAIAIGAVVGVERHWREREEREGQRTAGIRTFTLIGMFGGAAGLIEYHLSDGPGASGIVLSSFFAMLTGAFAVFQYRESVAEGRHSVTSVVAAMLVFALGALAILGDMALASAGGVVLLAILASREFLHRLMRRLSWLELRSAVILLALTFVLLPILPDEPIGPFGGISPTRILVLVIILASISFCGYVAVRLLGSSRGELVAGLVGGIVSSTAVTITNARRSGSADTASAAVTAGAVGAGAISFFRTAILVATLAPALTAGLLPALLGGGAAMIGYAALLTRRGAGEHAEQQQKNPFDLDAVVKMALLLVGVAFMAQAASRIFGEAGLIAVSALSGLADVDAATVTVAGMQNAISAEIAALAIGAALVSNMIAKAIYASFLGSARFRRHIWLATLLALAVAALCHVGARLV
ncbi:MgtC/SapB family protein [Sphingomonas cavernae]|uniref:DUF4010 domain-containing protein n=1 Tax=Sphingomonas cavernae TaxID=2320861 RepID=A0A418WN13_9SPHN|nr:DUF4010 domain-containing protein [Sphingomonas cavernae]RJF91394.1 DUF4010 domain-containing protein [Sphingomonas cavernae]